MSELGLGKVSVDPTTNQVRMTSVSSGIDTEALTDALYQAKRLPAVRLEESIDVNDAKVAAYQDLQGRLGAMQNALQGLRSPPGFNGVDDNFFEQKAAYFSSNTTTSPASLIGIQATNRSDIGSFDLRVEALASAHKVMSASFTSADEQLGIAASETLTIGLGTEDTADITLTSDMTVYDVADAINGQATTTNVGASVLKVGDDDFRLILTGQATGLDNDIQVSGAPDALARLDLMNGANKLADPSDAVVYVDEVQVSRSSNTITDLMSGLTIDLYQSEPGTTVTVEIEPDFTTAREAVAGFVDAYNSFRDFLDEQALVGEDGAVDKTTSPLFGDTLMRSLAGEIGLAIGASVNGIASTEPRTLADLGITLGEDNHLSLDIGKLDEKLVADPDAVRRVFEFSTQVSDPGLDIYAHSNALPSTSFDIEKMGDGTWQLRDGTNTITLEASGTTLSAPAGSAYHGLILFWNGDADPAGPISVTATQGIADRLYNTIERAVTDLGGTLQVAIDETQTQTADWREDVARIEERAEDYRLRLIDKFARLETALSLSESMLKQVRAQTDAMTADS